MITHFEPSGGPYTFFRLLSSLESIISCLAGNHFLILFPEIGHSFSVLFRILDNADIFGSFST